MRSQKGNDTTIAAISTPPGSGGIGIIRMSGPASLAVLKTIFSAHNPDCQFRSHVLYYGTVVDSSANTILDEVLAVYMRGPKTYTCEDVVEIHCHGSFLVLQNILELILQHEVELAEPGEFTKRAFFNGRIDLTRAEAVIDILAAKTRKGVDIAQEQLAGSLFLKVDAVRKALATMRALIEVAIDFPDEDIEIIDGQKLLEEMKEHVRKPIEHLIECADQGKIYREGVAVVIVGRPNVGKSSLLNMLLQEDRALVTAIPGTTRDSIEEYIDILGMPVKIADTAGIRQGADEVEELGIQRAKKLINQADIILFMVDGHEGILEEDQDLFATVSHKPLILLINKMDLPDSETLNNLAATDPSCPRLHISAKQQTGLEELRKLLFTTVTGGRDHWQEDSCSPNARHKQSLMKANEAATRVIEALGDGLTADLVAVDLQDCLDHLGDIVGETTTEDILDIIFEQFCLGK